MAVFQRQSPRGVILHLDRGVQYASKSFREKLEKHGMIQSMSGKGNCYDNAVTETFFKSLKTEWIYCHLYRNQEYLPRSVFKYIGVFLQSETGPFGVRVSLAGGVLAQLSSIPKFCFLTCPFFLATTIITTKLETDNTHKINPASLARHLRSLVHNLVTQV